MRYEEERIGSVSYATGDTYVSLCILYMFLYILCIIMSLNDLINRFFVKILEILKKHG